MPDTSKEATSLIEVFEELGLASRPLVPMPIKNNDRIAEGQLAKLMQLGCTLEECAYVLGCTASDLSKRCKSDYGFTFGELADHHRGAVKVALRRKQIEVALDGNVKMLTHLGQHVLGQVDGREEATPSNRGNDLSDATLIQIVNQSGATTKISGGRISHDAGSKEKPVGQSGSAGENPVDCGERNVPGGECSGHSENP